MKILVADVFPEAQRQQLSAAGHTIDYQPDLAADHLPDALADHDILVVRSTVVTAAVMESSDQLSLIVRAGAGTNTIDTTAAAGRGIYVCNTPGKNSIAVAELAMGLMAAIDRSLPDNVAELRAGRWDKSRFSQAEGLAGRRLGIVGIGHVGLEVARRARAFAMEIVVIDKPRDPEVAAELERLGSHTVPDLPTLGAECDIITFHVPATTKTKGLVGTELLAKAKPGAIIINTSRGEILDEDALIAAMDSKGVRAGLDVFSDEPSKGSDEFSSKLAQHPNVYGTHHIGASTSQAQRAIADAVAAIITEYEAGTVRNCVNLETGSAGTTSLSVRHYNRVGVLAQVLSVLRTADLNVEQMQNRIFAGGTAASVTIHVSGPLPAELVAKIRAIDNVIAVTLG